MIDSTHAAFAVSYPAKRVLVIGDTAQARVAGAEAAERLGAGVAAVIPIDGAIQRLADSPCSAVVMVEIQGDDVAALEPLLDQLEADARRGRPSIITVPRRMLDLAARRAGHGAISILCDPDQVERTAALGIALAGTSARLHDVGNDPGAVRLRQLSEEVGRIARTLASLSAEPVGRPGPRTALLEGLLPGASASPAREVEASTIRTMIRARRLRDQFFDRELFADPAWDILLDLTAARLERTPVAVSSLCIAAAVPPTTALRWIKTLTDAGLLVRAADTRDGRRVFIELSEPAAAGMIAYINAATKLGTLIG